MFSENFMRYLIAYQSEDMEPQEPKKEHKSEKKHLMIDLIGVKYAAVPVADQKRWRKAG